MFRECAGLEPMEPIWTDEATTRLERVPEGFMRRAAQDTVAEYARENGFDEITLEVAEGGMGKAREKMAAAMRGEKTDPHERRNRVSGGPQVNLASFECGMCGLVVDGDMPEQCPCCATDRFRGLSAAERDAVGESATIVMEWDFEALKRIERVPPGFMRTMTRSRIEQWARHQGYERISLPIVEEKYADWAEGSDGLESELEWSAEAMVRMEKIPDFIRPVVMREIEGHAKESGSDHVDAEAISRFLGTLSGFGEFHRTA